MPSYPGSVQMLGFPGPNDISGNYPSSWAKLQKGGWQSVADLAERNAIHTLKKEIGMRVFVQSNRVEYEWNGSAWVVSTGGSSGVLATYATLAAINGADISDGTQYRVANRATVGDGGFGEFYYVAGSTVTADGAMVIASADNAGRFFRHWDGGPINPIWFGAESVVGDRAGYPILSNGGSTLTVPAIDNAVPINAAITFANFPTYGVADLGATVVLPVGDWHHSTSIRMKPRVNFIADGVLFGPEYLSHRDPRGMASGRSRLWLKTGSNVPQLTFDDSQATVYNVTYDDDAIIKSPTVTISIAFPAVFTTTLPHNLVAGQPIYLYTSGTLPTGLTGNGTVYYVLAAGLTATQFQVSIYLANSTINSGIAVNTNGSQSGTHTISIGSHVRRQYGCLIKGIQFNGNAVGQTRNDCDGIRLTDAWNVKIDNCGFADHRGYELFLRELNGCYVNNCFFYSPEPAGGGDRRIGKGIFCYSCGDFKFTNNDGGGSTGPVLWISGDNAWQALYQQNLLFNAVVRKYTITNLTADELTISYILPNGTLLTVGQTYRIAAQNGTNFVALGAANNLVNTVFVATGTGTTATLDADDQVDAGHPYENGSPIEFLESAGSVIPNISDPFLYDQGLLTPTLRYRIVSRTDGVFTAVGSADNNVGTEFVATGTGASPQLLDSGDTVKHLAVALKTRNYWAVKTAFNKIKVCYNYFDAVAGTNTEMLSGGTGTNYIHHGVASGIYLTGGHDNSIMGNRTEQNMQHGITINGGRGNTILGGLANVNQFDTVNQVAATDLAAGVYLKNGSKYNCITGMVFSDWDNSLGAGGIYPQKYGIWIEANCGINFIGPNAFYPHDAMVPVFVDPTGNTTVEQPVVTTLAGTSIAYPTTLHAPGPSVAPTFTATPLKLTRDDIAKTWEFVISSDILKLKNTTAALDGIIITSSSSLLNVTIGGAGTSAAARATAIFGEYTGAGAGTDAAGAMFNFFAPAGNGASTTGGAYDFYTPDATTSGTTPQTQTAKWRITKEGALRATVQRATPPTVSITEGAIYLDAPLVGYQVYRNGNFIQLGRPVKGGVLTINTEVPTAGTTVTISIATPAVITWTAHGLAANTPVNITTTGALPTGLVSGRNYYVSSSGLNTNDFQVSLVPGGSVVNTSGTQSGTHTSHTTGAAFTAFPLITESTIVLIAPLTAGRTISLSTSSALPGATWDITRTAASTGAFNLSIDGLLNLAVNQWCRMAYNGSVWRQIAGGTLL